MTTKREIKNVFGGYEYKYNKTVNVNLDDTGDCKNNPIVKKSALAGSTAKLETKISNIVLN